MTSRVCIVGIGVMETNEPAVGLSHKELLFYATRKAMDDAGIERDDIGGAITSSYDFLEGRSLSNQFTLDSIGGTMKPCDLRLGDDGLHALFAGYMEVASDPSQIVVVASVQKASERDGQGLGFQKAIADSMEPVFSRPLCKSIPNPMGLEPVLAAMEARTFMERTGVSEEQIAWVAAKNLKNAKGRGKAPGIKDILGSELLSWPIREATTAREADAACTILLASEEKAKRLAGDPVVMAGIGWCADSGHLALRQPGLSRETIWAARQAYRMAGIRRPVEELDVAEISDWYAHRELMHCEALDFCGSGELGAKVDEGAFARDGRLPVNVSGGLLGRGNAIGTSGLIRAAQVVEQLRGRANGQQVPGASVGLAQSWSGPPVATAGVVVLSKL